MCACEETRISYTRPDGNGGVARVSYRCAEHRPAKRAADVKRWHMLDTYATARARRSVAAPVTNASLLRLPAPETQGLTPAHPLQ